MKYNFYIVLVLLFVASSLVLYRSIRSERIDDPDTSATGKISTSDTPSDTSALHSQWPMFRGNPALNGWASGRLEDSLRLYWKFKTDDEIKSSPVISAGVVYIGSGDGRLYALQQKNGKVKWSYQTPDAIEAPPYWIDNLFVVSFRRT